MDTTRLGISGLIVGLLLSNLYVQYEQLEPEESGVSDIPYGIWMSDDGQTGIWDYRYDHDQSEMTF